MEVPRRYSALVDRVRPEHREDEVAGELLPEVVDEDGRRAEELRLAARGPELLALAEIGGEGHDVAAVALLQPSEDDGGVEAAGVGEHDLVHVRHAELRIALQGESTGPPRRPGRDSTNTRPAPPETKRRIACEVHHTEAVVGKPLPVPGVPARQRCPDRAGDGRGSPGRQRPPSPSPSQSRDGNGAVPALGSRRCTVYLTLALPDSRGGIAMAISERPTTVVSTKGQVILPKAIRRSLGWEAGTRLVVEDTSEGVLLRPAPVFAETRSEDVFGRAHQQGRAEVAGGDGGRDPGGSEAAPPCARLTPTSS